MIRFLANLHKQNSDPSIMSAIIGIRQLLINFSLFTARSQPDDAITYTFGACIYLMRILMYDEYDDEFVFVFLEVTELLMQSKRSTPLFTSIEELLVDLLKTQEFDIVLMFVHKHLAAFGVETQRYMQLNYNA